LSPHARERSSAAPEWSVLGIAPVIGWRAEAFSPQCVPWRPDSAR
jgi:hypothetical protein